LNGNSIDTIENLDGLYLEELHLQQNRIKKITGLENLPVLKNLDLSKNQISKLKGLESTLSLRFLNLALNNVSKVGQLVYIENLPLLTQLDLCFNPIQNKKHYRLQVLFHIPQLRQLDGVEVLSEEKVKAENLHGMDLNDRKLIF
jgi:Leucine-rich repeat (LRR) protein